jgi:hypothetical protein
MVMGSEAVTVDGVAVVSDPLSTANRATLHVGLPGMGMAGRLTETICPFPQAGFNPVPAEIPPTVTQVG